MNFEHKERVAHIEPCWYFPLKDWNDRNEFISLGFLSGNFGYVLYAFHGNTRNAVVVVGDWPWECRDFRNDIWKRLVTIGRYVAPGIMPMLVLFDYGFCCFSCCKCCRLQWKCFNGVESAFILCLPQYIGCVEGVFLQRQSRLFLSKWWSHMDFEKIG